MMTMETVELGDVNVIASQSIDNNDKGSVSLEQIQIEESEERWRLWIFDNIDSWILSFWVSDSDSWLMTREMNYRVKSKHFAVRNM